MRYLVPIFGSRIQFELEEKTRKMIVHREFSSIAFDIEIGLELRGGRKYRLLSSSAPQEVVPCFTLEQGAGCLTMAGYDPASGLRLTCMVSNTFEADNEKASCVPAVLFECRAERVRKEPDNVAGNIFFKINPCKGKVDVESAMRLMVGYYVNGASYNPNYCLDEQNRYEMIRVRDHILPTRGKVRGKAIKQPFFFQYGKEVDTMRFVWCMHDPVERYCIRHCAGQYFYNRFFKNIYQVEEYMVKEEWNLRKKRDAMLLQRRMSSGGKRLNEIMAYAFHSLIGSVGYYLENEKDKRVLLLAHPDGSYNHFHTQFYMLPFYKMCQPQLLREIVLEWRQFRMVKRERDREIFVFPDGIGSGYKVDPQPPEKINAANSIYFILYFYAVYKMEADENILWVNRNFLHKVFSFVFLDFKELQYMDLFSTIGKFEITEYLPFSVLAKLEMVLCIIRELIYLLEMQRKDADYLPRLDELEKQVKQKMHIAFYKIPEELPYYDISDMVYYQITFRNENVWGIEKAVDYIHMGWTKQFCPHGKGSCQLDEVQVMHYCPYSKKNRDVCAEHFILRDLLLSRGETNCFGKLIDYEAWVSAEKKETENAYPLPELTASMGYLSFRQQEKQNGETE